MQEGCTKLSVVNDWITQMHFVVETDALIIASVDGTVSFLDVARGAVIRTFSAHDNTKIGTVCVIVGYVFARVVGWDLSSIYIVRTRC